MLKMLVLHIYHKNCWLVDNEHVPGGQTDIRSRQRVEKHPNFQLSFTGGVVCSDAVDILQWGVRLSRS